MEILNQVSAFIIRALMLTTLFELIGAGLSEVDLAGHSGTNQATEEEVPLTRSPVIATVPATVTVASTSRSGSNSIPTPRGLRCNANSSPKDCPYGMYSGPCGQCRTCRGLGDFCDSAVQCCISEHMVCRNFSAFAVPQCVCAPEYQWNADTLMCFLPVTIPQQLLLIAVYSGLAVMVTVGVAATLLHVLRSQLGMCRWPKPRPQASPSSPDEEDPGANVLQRHERPPPYSPPHSNRSSVANGVGSGLSLTVPLAVGLSVGHVPEPPPAYEDLASLTRSPTGSRAHSSSGETSTVVTLEPSIERAHFRASNEECCPLPQIIVTPPTMSLPPLDNLGEDSQLVSQSEITITITHVPQSVVVPLRAASETNSLSKMQIVTVSEDELPCQMSAGFRRDSVPKIIVTPPSIEACSPSRDPVQKSITLPEFPTSESAEVDSNEPEPAFLSLPVMRFDYNKFLEFEKSRNLPASIQSSMQMDMTSCTSPAAHM